MGAVRSLAKLQHEGRLSQPPAPFGGFLFGGKRMGEEKENLRIVGESAGRRFSWVGKEGFFLESPERKLRGVADQTRVSTL